MLLFLMRRSLQDAILQKMIAEEPLSSREQECQEKGDLKRTEAVIEQGLAALVVVRPALDRPAGEQEKLRLLD